MEEEHTRCAAVLRDETEALGIVVRPHLRRRQDISDESAMNDELAWLEGEVSPYVKLSIKGLRSVDEVVEASVSSDTRGGGVQPIRPLVFWENMICGAVSRSVAQTIMHPANTMKTILQSDRGTSLNQLMKFDQFGMLTRGAGANFLLSLPHGAVNFAVLEFVRGRLGVVAETVPLRRKRLDSIGPALDFTSSALSTICCSVISTPQMMITDNIMAGNYPNLPNAITGLYSDGGIIGFYRGWLPGLVGKIPSYVRFAQRF